MGAMLYGNQETEVIQRQAEERGLQSKFGVQEFHIPEVSRGAPQVLNGVLVEVRMEDCKPSVNHCTLQTSWLPASVHNVEKETVPLLMLLNVSGMPLRSKLVVKRKTRVRHVGEIFYMSLLANRKHK